MYPSQFVIYILTLNSSTIYYLRISHLEHHKYILITISYYNPSYETLSTSPIIHLFSFTYHTANRYPSYNITYIFHNLYLSHIFNDSLSLCYNFMLKHSNIFRFQDTYTIMTSCLTFKHLNTNLPIPINANIIEL